RLLPAPAARPRRPHRRGSTPSWPRRSDRKTADDSRRTGDREGRDQRLHESRRRRSIARDSRRGRARDRRRRSHPLRAGHDVREGAVPGPAACDAHPSDGVGAHSHRARRAEAMPRLIFVLLLVSSIAQPPRGAPSQAPGAPGAKPTWTNGNKQGVGTSTAQASKVWFTLGDGVLTEAYYPTVDKANLRTLEFVVTDGAGFFERESVDTDHV